MPMDLALWLFAGAYGAILGVLGFCWHCHSTRGSEIVKLREDFYLYKVHVAEHFATVTLTTAVERRMVDSLEEIKTSLREQNGKIDRLVEGRVGK